MEKKKGFNSIKKGERIYTFLIISEVKTPLFADKGMINVRLIRAIQTECLNH